MKIEEQNSSKQRGRQILESIVRALIKLIPVAGDAIDQATFGSKDAIEDQELRETVQEIYKILLEVSKKGSVKVNQGAETILPEIFISPNIPKIVSKLDNISSQDLKRLIQIIFQLQSNHSETSEIIRTFRVSIENIQSQQQQAVEQLNDTKITLQNIENSILKRLEKLEEFVMKNSYHYELRLSEIYEELNNPSTCRMASDILPRRPLTRLTTSANSGFVEYSIILFLSRFQAEIFK